MAFIGRRGDNTIYGVWTVQQWKGQEELPDTNPEVVAFRKPPAPVDQSDLDKVEKQLKALALCVAQIGGLTVPQMKALFKQKWETLP